MVVSSGGTVAEVNHYYPFGGVFASSNNVQPYKYNGKELDTKKGLNWYDYGARHYDAALGRWFTVDPLAEKDYLNSPYNYCGNNPVSFVDPTGKMKVIYNPDGTYKETTHNNWFHNTFMGRQEFIDYGDKLTRLSEEQFWLWQETGNWSAIQKADKLTSFEFWLDSPSDNMMDGVIKFAVSETYSLLNSPFSVLTGRTLGGTLQTSEEKMESFIGVIEMLPITRPLKVAHPGASKYFYKKHGENYFTRKSYEQKVKQYIEINKNKDSFNWIYNYLITPLNEVKEDK